MNEAASTQTPQAVQPLVVELDGAAAETFARLAAGWQLEPAELARRWCEELTHRCQPGHPVVFIEHTDRKETA